MLNADMVAQIQGLHLKFSVFLGLYKGWSSHQKENLMAIDASTVPFIQPNQQWNCRQHLSHWWILRIGILLWSSASTAGGDCTFRFGLHRDQRRWLEEFVINDPTECVNVSTKDWELLQLWTSLPQIDDDLVNATATVMTSATIQKCKRVLWNITWH